MTIPQNIYEQRDAILALANTHGATNIRVFGSVVRQESTPTSDIDFLVDMDPHRSLLDRIGFLQDLQELFGCPVDVVTAQALHWSIRDQVLAEAVPLVFRDEG